MRPAVLAFACAIACSTVDSHAAALSQQQIDDISRVAAETLQMQGLPALSVAVAKQGDIWSAAFGKADVEQDVAATPQSMFRTASVAKWFTGVAAMRLVESGALNLDAPIQRYCRQYPRKSWP